MSVVRIVLFLAVVLSVYGGAHYYLWARLVRDPALPQPWAALATAALVLLGLLVFVGFVLLRAAPRSVAGPVLWVGYTWMGVAFFLFLSVATVDLVRRFMPRAEGVDDERRTLLARAFAGGATLLGGVLGGAALTSGLGPVVVRRIPIALRGLAASKAGYRIVQLSDVHIGPTLGREFLETIVAQCNALAPDMVVITGDLVDGSVAELGPLVAPLAGLQSKDGVYFVTGNHEYYSGADEWIAFLPTLGVRVLRNERVSIGGAEGFDLAGVDDVSARPFGGDHGMDLARALRGRDEARPVVLLAHQPRAVKEAAAAGVDLQLSGHTHGGQLFPFHALVRLTTPFLAGHFTVDATQLYVSRGTGYWGPPMRLAAPAEVTEIVLQPGAPRRPAVG